MILTIETLLSHFLDVKLESKLQIISKIKDFYNNNTTISLEKNIYLRKYSGKNEINGLLDYLPDSIQIYDYNYFPDINASDLVLGPLNIEDLGFYYSKILQNKCSVFPIIHPIIASKFFRNMIFNPFIPTNLYIPQGSFHLIDKFDFTTYFKERNVSHVIIKDENGFHTGQMVPYRITPVEHIASELKKYKTLVDRIDNFGGLIVEEFVGGKHSEIYKCHIYGELIPGEVIKYDVYLKNLQGVLKSYDKNVPDLLQKVDSTISSLPNNISKSLNPLIKKHLPYLFSSIDFVIDQTTEKIKIIDVNSIAGSLGEIQELNNNNNHNPFEFFFQKSLQFPKDEYKKIQAYLQELDTKFSEKYLLEGIISFDQGQSINLLQ